MDCSPLTLFVVSESVRREMLSRLNHERWEEETRNQELGIGEEGKSQKSKVKGRKKPKSAGDGQMGLL